MPLPPRPNDANRNSTNYNSAEIIAAANQLLHTVPKYRSGDKFVHVYRNWARLEERYGSFESVDRVYERARIAFPNDYKLLLSWAQYHSNIRNHDKARAIFQDACNIVGNRYVHALSEVFFFFHPMAFSISDLFRPPLSTRKKKKDMRTRTDCPRN